MNPPTLIDTNGRPFTLDRRLASGGEGAVFTLTNYANLVAKVYHHPPTQQTVEKLKVMTALANPQLLTLAAWPSGLLHHSKTRQVLGFVMPRLVDCQPIQHLYNPVQRLRFFPRAGWTFQLRAAVNLAAAFDEVHKAGCLVGDVNQSNAFVSPQALVRLIDCDSFQVQSNGKQYLCEVGVPHYTPPELQRKSLRGLVRTKNHDRFGLAVLLYQLLFVGKHPYMGLYSGPGDPGFEHLIGEFRFAQGPSARSWGMSPPPHTPTFADIPLNVNSLFRRALERGSERENARPQPTEWLIALKQLEQNISECTADTGHTYWREVKNCIWCRLATNGGPEYYFGVASGIGNFAVDEAKLQDVVRRLAACKLIEFGYDRDRYAPARAPVAEPLPSGLEEYHHTGFLGFVSRVWHSIVGSQSPWDLEYHRRRISRERTLDDLDEMEKEWERTVRNYHRKQSELTGSLHGLISDCRGLTSQHQGELQRLTTNAEALARVRHLRLHLLADADIPKIGAGRKQILAAHNIFTAEDIDGITIFGIKGFGEALTNNLMAWRAEVLRQFRFEPATAVSPGDQRSMTVKFRTRQQQILAELDRQLISLESLTPECRSAIQQLIPGLREAVARWEQAEADLGLLR
jgi:DNA-binding helix-hairpin-helix protein with protein kinase domain